MNDLASPDLGRSVGQRGSTDAMEDFEHAARAGTSGVLGGQGLSPARSRRAPAASILARTVGLDIVPRLLLAHPAAPSPDRSDAGAADRARHAKAEVAEMAALILAHDISGARLYAEAVMARGASVETLSLDLLAPAARLMGTMWVDDVTDFTSVSLGVWQLHQLMHDFSPGFTRKPPHATPDRRVLLTALPGEQHTFGVAMVAEFFRNAGWHVLSGPLETQQELTRMVRKRWFAVVGLSLSWSHRLDTLATAIRAVRRASLNPAVGVMVGGSLFGENPDLVRLVGADASATDASSAPTQAAGLVSLMARQN